MSREVITGLVITLTSETGGNMDSIGHERRFDHLMSMCFSDWSFAVNANGEEMWSMSWIIHFIVSVLSRIWVLFSKLAGEFLTNSWVY